MLCSLQIHHQNIWGLNSSAAQVCKHTAENSTRNYRSCTEIDIQYFSLHKEITVRTNTVRSGPPDENPLMVKTAAVILH